MEKEYAKQIETLLTEYFEYRKVKDEKPVMQSVEIADSTSKLKSKELEWFPDPLPLDNTR